MKGEDRLGDDSANCLGLRRSIRAPSVRPKPRRESRNFDQCPIEEAAQTIQLKFLHNSGITLCPEGTVDVSRWANHRTRLKPPSQPRRRSLSFPFQVRPLARLDEASPVE